MSILQSVHADWIVLCEAGEQWSFVQKKKRRHWLWYAYDTLNKRVLAHVFGPRTNKTCRRLLDLLKSLRIICFATDDWGSYPHLIPRHQHIIGKAFTQSIERHNLSLRTHIKRLARKTICFSKSIEMHEKVIGYYLTIYHYQ